jgi:hypothetical protein
MKSIDELVEEYAANTPGGLTATKKALLRASLQKEDEFWARYVANEERPDNNKCRDDY